MRMVQRGYQARFPRPALAELRLDELQRDVAAQARVDGLVDNPHASFAERFEDEVMRDGLADHSAGLLANRRILTYRFRGT